MLRLHYYPSNASMAPHIVLHELGVPFELALVDRERNAQRSAEYLRLNPNGTIPVLVDGDTVLHETAAILVHLAERHPEAHLAPAAGTPERARFYTSMFWLSNTLQATLISFFYPDRWTDEGEAAAVQAVQRQAQRRAGQQLDVLEAQLVLRGGPWLLGADFTVADPLAFMLCR
jgi:glutathione S-transferase